MVAWLNDVSYFFKNSLIGPIYLNIIFIFITINLAPAAYPWTDRDNIGNYKRFFDVWRLRVKKHDVVNPLWYVTVIWW